MKYTKMHLYMLKGSKRYIREGTTSNPVQFSTPFSVIMSIIVIIL